MKLIKVGVASLNQTALDWRGNQRRILHAIAQARAQRVSVLCLPEMCISGYGCEDAFHAANTSRLAWRMLREIVPATRDMIVALGLPILHQNGLFDCACLAVDGRIAGFAAKRYLAGDGIHYEPRWFKPWPADLRAEIEMDGEAFPLGDYCFDCGGVRVGFEICEDAWVASRPGAALALKGVDVILNPSASHFAFRKVETRQRLALEGSRAFGATYLLANLVGNEAGRAIYDGGSLIAVAGNLAALAPRFSFQETVVASAVVDVETTRMSQARTGSFQPRITAETKDIIHAPFQWPAVAMEPWDVSLPAWETGPAFKEEEFARAEALALFDYMRKSRADGFVLSLSGGADSSSIACLAHLMCAFALAELGPEGVAERLSHIRGFAPANGARALTSRLLTTAYQGSDNSGEVTRRAARAVAEAVGACHYEWSIGGLVGEYTQIIQKATGLHLNWKEHDIALQNIQARVRSPGIWLLTNLKNALLLAASNRSEAAVGYATMDGDTSGGLSPLAGIDKAWLRQWLRWMEKTGPAGFFAIPALAAVNNQEPTAELRPPERKQTDEDDLMPYEILDAIERAFIRDRRSAAEVFETLRAQFPAAAPEQLGVWIDRFFKLWRRNQWKRERYAPSFHLDDENLDPKTWCRFPILSGDLETELAELGERLKRP